MKRRIADGSVGLPHVRVGHRQAFIKKTPEDSGVFFCLMSGGSRDPRLSSIAIAGIETDTRVTTGRFRVTGTQNASYDEVIGR